MGFRALTILLRNYQRIYQCDTINAIVRRFAPPSENPTSVYASEVAHECGVDPFAPVDLNDREFAFKLCKAMTRFETGSWEPYWNDNQLSLGIGLTGLYPITIPIDPAAREAA